MNDRIQYMMRQQPSVPKEQSYSKKQRSSEKTDDFRQMLEHKSEPKADSQPEKPRKESVNGKHEEEKPVDMKMEVSDSILNGIQIPTEFISIQEMFGENEEIALASDQEILTLGVFGVEEAVLSIGDEGPEQAVGDGKTLDSPTDDGIQGKGTLTIPETFDKYKTEAAGLAGEHIPLVKQSTEQIRNGEKTGTQNREVTADSETVNQGNVGMLKDMGALGSDSRTETDTESGQGKQQMGRELHTAQSEKPETISETALENAGKEGMSGYLRAGSVENTGQVHTPETVKSAESTQDSELMKQVSDYLNKNALKGAKELELQLNPKELGKLSIHIASQDGRTEVTILCSSSKTLKALSENAGEIGRIMETNLGTPTNIVTEYKEDENGGYSEQNQNDSQNQGWNGGTEDKSGGKNHSGESRRDSRSFVQQLRLGLA